MMKDLKNIDVKFVMEIQFILLDILMILFKVNFFFWWKFVKIIFLFLVGWKRFSLAAKAYDTQIIQWFSDDPNIKEYLNGDLIFCFNLSILAFTPRNFWNINRSLKQKLFSHLPDLFKVCALFFFCFYFNLKKIFWWNSHYHH